MKINSIRNYINFKSTPLLPHQNNAEAVPQQPQYQPVNTIPSILINPNMPMGYTKINEYYLPGTNTKVETYKLANGQTIVLVPKKGKTQINTYISCGSMNETDDIRGISHFIEHNLFNGSKNIKPKELFATVNKMGAYTNAWTSEFATSYTIQSHLFDSEDLSKIISLHADMIQNPQFEQSQLDKEKGVVNSEITMYDDNNFRMLLGKSTKQLFQIDSDSNDLVGGTVKNINNLTRNDVISYYNKNYTPDRMTTVLTGDFDPQYAIGLISKNFTKQVPPSQGHIYHEKLTPIDKTVRSDYNSELIQNDEFSISLKGPENNNLKDTLCTKIILSMLTGAKHSRLDKNLKPFNISPEMIIETSGNRINDPQIISLFASSNPKNTEDALKIIFSTIHNMNFEKLEEDLVTEKKAMAKNLYMAFETGDRINEFLGRNLKNFSPEEIQKLPEIINSITSYDLKNALQKYFDLNKASIVVSHPAKIEPPAPENSVAFKGKLIKKGLDLSEFKYAKLQNNADIYLKEDNSKLKHFSIDINTNIPANVNPMLLEVFTKILSKGSIFSTEEDFSKDLAKKSSSVCFYVDAKGISASGDSLSEDINYTLSKVVEALRFPKLNKQTLDEVKSQIEKEITDKIPSSNDFINPVMFPQRKSAPTKDDQIKALKEINLSDILGFCEYLKQNSSLHFIWNKGEIPYILNDLGQFKPANTQEFRTYTPLEKDILKTQTYNIGQANISKSYKFEHSGTTKEFANISIMNMVFGGGQASRLFTDLREAQKLAYHTGSKTEKYGNTGIITMNIGTTTDNPQDTSANSSNITKSLEGFNRNIEKMKNEYITEDELESAKLSAKSAILNALETSSSKTTSLLDCAVEYKNINFLNELLLEIDKVTVEDVRNTAQKVFGGHSLTSIVASEKTLKELNLQ